MWLITTLFAAILTTAIWYVASDKYKLGFLCLMLWGAAAMILVDHVLGFLAEGGPFFNTGTDDMLLSVYILIPVLVVWEIALIIDDPKGKLTVKGGV